MSQDLKQHAIGIGAARPFSGPSLHDDDIGIFAGVPFLTNPGVVPCDTIEFGDGSALRIWSSRAYPPEAVLSPRARGRTTTRCI